MARLLSQVAEGATLTVGNVTPVAVVCPIPGANYAQAFIRDDEVQQAFIVTLVNNTTVRVPSTGGWEMDVDTEIPEGATAFSLQTATSEVDFQILFMRKRV